MARDQIVPFEEGDVMYERDVKSVYEMFSTQIQKLSLTGLYGTTKYKTNGSDKNYRQNEVSAWLSYLVAQNLKAFLIYDQVFKAKPGYPSLRQIGAGLTYSF